MLWAVGHAEESLPPEVRWTFPGGGYFLEVDISLRWIFPGGGYFLPATIFESCDVTGLLLLMSPTLSPCKNVVKKMKK